jgi:hypothetical protein
MLCDGQAASGRGGGWGSNARERRRRETETDKAAEVDFMECVHEGGDNPAAGQVTRK